MKKKALELKNKNIPKLRFARFSDVWHEKRLGEILKIGSGRDYKHLEKGNTPVFGTGGYMLSVNKSLYNGETVFIGRKGTINKPFYYNGDFWTVDTLFYTHSFNDVTPKFTDLIFQKINWLKYNEASGVPSLSKATIEKIKVNLPSIQEQQKIAEFLGSVNSWINNLKEQKEFFESYKKGMMQKIFSQEIRFKNKNVIFPEWKDVVLKDVVSRFATGLNPRNNFVLGKGENYYVTIKNISNGELDFNSCETIDDSALKKINGRSDLRAGDIILASIGNIGDSYLIETKPENWNINESVFSIRPLADKVVQKFLYYIITNNNTRNYFTSSITGSSFKSIKMKELKLTPLRLPCIGEQQRIADFLTSVDKVIESKQQQIILAEEWKKGLMQDLFI